MGVKCSLSSIWRQDRSRYNGFPKKCLLIPLQYRIRSIYGFGVVVVGEGGEAFIHSAKQMSPLLESYVKENLGVVRVGGGFDHYFAMSAARVRTLHENQEQDPCGLLLVKFPTTAINRVKISDVVKLAVESERGIMFYIFEDW